VTPEESPRRSLGVIRSGCYTACADHEHLAPLPVVEELRVRRRAMAKSKSMTASTTASPFLRRCCGWPAAERHWERLILLYH
jgi:carboxymethylenebutenolidase